LEHELLYPETPSRDMSSWGLLQPVSGEDASVLNYPGQIPKNNKLKSKVIEDFSVEH